VKFGSAAAPTFQWAGQTDLPIVGNSLTLTAGSDVPYYVGFY